MRAVVQRISSASVEVENTTVGKCGTGLLVYLGIGKDDTEKDLKYLADKIAQLRIFSDDNGKMNKSLHDINGGVLIVSQFTLYADTRKGRRPSYNRAAEPEKAEKLYNMFIESLKNDGISVSSGIFQAHMKVSSLNDGPITILLDSNKDF